MITLNEVKLYISLIYCSILRGLSALSKLLVVDVLFKHLHCTCCGSLVKLIMHFHPLFTFPASQCYGVSCCKLLCAVDICISYLQTQLLIATFADHRKLPFMAMLRNIRNMIKAGISEKHHSWVLHKLSDEVLIYSYECRCCCCCCCCCTVVVVQNGDALRVSGVLFVENHNSRLIE